MELDATNLHVTSATFDVLLVPLLLLACTVVIRLVHAYADLLQSEEFNRSLRHAKQTAEGKNPIAVTFEVKRREDESEAITFFFLARPASQQELRLTSRFSLVTV